MYRARGPVEMKPVGEVEFAAGVAAMSDSGIYGPTRVCAGIVGHADLRLGARARDVLEAHIRAGGGRFRGIRHITAWDPNPTLLLPSYAAAPGLMADSVFRHGLCLPGAAQSQFRRYRRWWCRPAEGSDGQAGGLPARRCVPRERRCVKLPPSPRLNRTGLATTSRPPTSDDLAET